MLKKFDLFADVCSFNNGFRKNENTDNKKTGRETSVTAHAKFPLFGEKLFADFSCANQRSASFSSLKTSWRHELDYFSLLFFQEDFDQVVVLLVFLPLGSTHHPLVRASPAFFCSSTTLSRRQENHLHLRRPLTVWARWSPEQDEDSSSHTAALSCNIIITTRQKQ